MTDRLTTLLVDLQKIAQLDSRQRAELIRRSDWIREATTDEVNDLLAELNELPPANAPDQQTPLTAVLNHLGVRLRAMTGPSTEQHVWSGVRSAVASLYRHLGPDHDGGHHLLAALASSAAKGDLEQFVELVVSDPPTQSDLALLAFAPLFQQAGDATPHVFPRLLDGLQHPTIAAPILDLANYATRQKLMARHPAVERTKQLAELLGQLAERLNLFEQQIHNGESSAERLAADQRQVAESLALAVSLCDALALIGDPSVAGKLYRAMDLGHRHVRTEAASALARLGEEAGKQELMALAAEPIVRLRVLAYAEELGMLDEVAAEYRSPVARAEAELVLWLADPAQFGMPPQQVDMLDSRRQFWPGYDEPVDCYLFRYTYRLPQGELSNVCLAGPLVHGFAADFTDVPVTDVYAAFAGWQTEHDEIVEYDANQLPAEHLPQAEVIERRLHSDGYDSMQIRRYGLFFGRLVLVATAVHNGSFGSVVSDADHSFWCPQAEGPWPLGPDEAYNMYKGRSLLEMFNP
jgi:hypothetical protein